MDLNNRRILFKPGEENICLNCFPYCPIKCFPPPDNLSFDEFMPPLSSIFPPPLPPPPPLPSSPLLSPFLIVLIAILGSFFLVMSIYTILVCVKCCWNNNRRRRRNTPQQDQDPDHNNMLQEFMDENHGPVIDHPIWYITTVGLEQAIINGISVCKYKKGEGLVEGTDCSVCLSEFEEGETLRLLPKCSHAFHLPCIDTWLRNHKNCPLCRAPIVSSQGVGVSNAIVPIPEEDLDVVEETRVEIPESSSGVEMEQSVDSVVSDVRIIGIQEEIELQEVRRDVDLVKEGEDSATPNCETPVVRDLGENRGSLVNAVQPVRRSVSMDFSSMFCFSMANSFRVDLEVNPELQPVKSNNSELAIVPKNTNPGVLGLVGSSSKGRALQSRPVSMKRSFSSGAKLFIPRHNHNRSSILPLAHSVLAVDGLNGDTKVRGVNLGGWLVLEGWIKPSLFDGIPNGDMLDGTQVQLKSVSLNKYVSAQDGGGQSVTVDRDDPSSWETFRLWRLSESDFHFRTLKGQFLSCDGVGASVTATSELPSARETFHIERNDNNRVHIKLSSGTYLQVSSGNELTADYAGVPGWDDNAATFELIIVTNTLHGDYQLANGYGPEKAKEVLDKHRSTYITREDFQFLYQHGINTVRIPVGWWIAEDPNPPAPYVGGSLASLDDAFSWAQWVSYFLVTCHGHITLSA